MTQVELGMLPRALAFQTQQSPNNFIGRGPQLDRIRLTGQGLSRVRQESPLLTIHTPVRACLVVNDRHVGLNEYIVQALEQHHSKNDICPQMSVFCQLPVCEHRNLELVSKSLETSTANCFLLPAHPGRLQVPGSLPPMGETHTGILDPGLGLVQP